MPTVFLFGAGASYGSDGGGRPPLGADLFGALAAFNPPGWGTITGDLAANFQRDFEAAFATVQPHAYGPLLRVMGGYFFQFTSRPTNLYFVLAQRIRTASAWSTSLCSLNYDPYWSPQGKAYASIARAAARGEITPEEAIAAYRRLTAAP